MKIRLATIKDYNQVIALYNKFVGGNRYSKPSDDSFSQVVGSKTGFMYVAEEDKNIVGYATFSTRFVVRYPKQIAELDELFVDEDWRHHGVGKKLMQAVLTKTKKLGCYRLYIESAYKHETAHRFYEKLGFTNYGYHFYKSL